MAGVQLLGRVGWFRPALTTAQCVIAENILGATFTIHCAVKTTVAGTVLIAVNSAPIPVEMLVARARKLAAVHAEVALPAGVGRIGRHHPTRDAADTQVSLRGLNPLARFPRAQGQPTRWSRITADGRRQNHQRYDPNARPFGAELLKAM